MKCITSHENPFFKRLIKLEKSAKQRKVEGLAVLDGVHLIDSYWTALGPPKFLIVGESGCERTEIRHLLTQGEKDAVSIFVLNDVLFSKVSSVKTSTFILAIIAIPKPSEITSKNKNKNSCALLEAIQDPGNLGSMLRSAAAAKVNDIYLSGDCVDAWSPKVLRAAMGAHFLLRIYEKENIAKAIHAFHGKVVAVTLKTEKNLYQTKLTGQIAFVFGNEGTGLSDEILKNVSEQITIPMSNGVESLNVAVAAAVCFFEKMRQDKKET